jgi:aminoglycoside phosphotransferase (APT) family kinase protein
MTDITQELAELSAIVGAPVVAAERCGWGFENLTAIVTLGDGGRLVVQRILSRATAAHKLRLGQVLPERLAAVGIRTPRQIAADPDASPPFAVREYLPDEAAASRMGTVAGAVSIARAMGELLPRLARVAAEGAGLDTAWASPARLAKQARAQIERQRDLLDDTAVAALEETIADLPARFADRPAQFAHGDFCPVNALVAGDRVTGLLDLEFARVADPLFDAAWWGWVVRYHHAERWVHAWPELLTAGGIPNDAETSRRVRAIQRLRCLEMIDYHAQTRTPESAANWVGRLGATLAWD